MRNSNYGLPPSPFSLPNHRRSLNGLAIAGIVLLVLVVLVGTFFAYAGAVMLVTLPWGGIPFKYAMSVALGLMILSGLFKTATR